MRLFAMLLLVAVAVPCHAEDPLETLNTIQDTVKTMQQALKQHRETKGASMVLAAGSATERLPGDDWLYFTSEEDLGTKPLLPVRPCTEEVALARAGSDAQSCVGQADGTVAMGGHFWKSRPANLEDLRVGALVVIQDKAGDGEWFLARVAQSGASGGFVATSAPFRAPLKGLRVVE